MFELIKMLFPFAFLGFATESEGGIATDEISGENETEDSETSAESSTEKTEGKTKPAEGEKTESEEGSAESEESRDEEEEGSPIPYKRFKQVNDKVKTLETDLEEFKGYMHNPIVLRAILQNQGVKDKKAQDKYLRDLGFEIEEEIAPKDETRKKILEGIDLKTTDGWFTAFERMMEAYGEKLISPIQEKLSASEAKEYISKEETVAKKLAEEVFKLSYGIVGKDEDNPETAIGKMWAYLQNHPEHAKLGHSTILRLAMSEEGFKLGEQKGVQKEKTRHESLRRSAMEEEGETMKEEEPSPDWDFEKLRKWHRKHYK